MNMSTAKFSTLEDDLKEIIAQVRRKVDGRLTTSSGEEQKMIIRDIERMNDDANNLMRSMEEEIQRAPTYERPDMRSRLASSKVSLDNSLRKMQSFTRNLNDIDDLENVQRSRLMAGTRSLQRASDSVARSRQIAAETDEIGVDVIGELGRQGEQLEKSRDRLKETQGALSKSRTILRGMAVRVVTNKLIMVVIILLELGILAGVVYWKFFT